MSIVVYTKGVPVEGGGGRRVTSELLHHFNIISGRAVSWSVLPLRPESLYGGRYVYEARHVLDDFADPADFGNPGFCRRCAEDFLATIREEAPDFLLFDTEYSLREFTAWSEGLVDPDGLPPRGVLVHDQLWKWNPAVLPLGAGGPDAAAVARACPLPGLAGYVVQVKRVLREADADSDGSGLIDLACSVEPPAVSGAGIDPEEERRLLGVKRTVNGVDRVFCLTGRSVAEAVAAYNLAPENCVQASPLWSEPGCGPDTGVRGRYGLGGSRGVLAFSRMSPEKNVEIVLLAFARFLALNPEDSADVDLWIAGQLLPEFAGYQREIRDLAARLGLEDRVRFIGTTSDAEMLGLYDAAETFICAQVADFNLSVAMALQRGLPVVTFGGYDFPEELAKAPSLFCRCNTVDDMARSLGESLGADGLAAAESAVLERHTFYNYAQKVIGAFAGMAHRPNPALGDPSLERADLRARCAVDLDRRLARVDRCLADGLHEEAMRELNVLEVAGGTRLDDRFRRLESLRVDAGRRSLYPRDIRKVGRQGPPISAYANRYPGKRAFVVGNGPSLGQLDLSPLRHEYVFGVNSLFLLFDDLGFKPDFYVVEDTLVAEDNAEIINGLSGFPRFYGRYLQYCLDDSPEVTWLNVVFDYAEYAGFPHFGPDAEERIWVGGTVSYLNMQLARYMGFDEVYLVGFDHSYVIPDSARREGTVITSTEDDVNHFHSEYFGKGKRWHDPFLDRMEKAYARAGIVYRSTGRSIMNATRGGKLEIFPRVRYESLFADKAKAGKRS